MNPMRRRSRIANTHMQIRLPDPFANGAAQPGDPQRIMLGSDAPTMFTYIPPGHRQPNKQHNCACGIITLNVSDCEVNHCQHNEEKKLARTQDKYRMPKKQKHVCMNGARFCKWICLKTLQQIMPLDHAPVQSTSTARTCEIVGCRGARPKRLHKPAVHI